MPSTIDHSNGGQYDSMELEIALKSLLSSKQNDSSQSSRDRIMAFKTEIANRLNELQNLRSTRHSNAHGRSDSFSSTRTKSPSLLAPIHQKSPIANIPRALKGGQYASYEEVASAFREEGHFEPLKDSSFLVMPNQDAVKSPRHLAPEILPQIAPGSPLSFYPPPMYIPHLSPGAIRYPGMLPELFRPGIPFDQHPPYPYSQTHPLLPHFGLPWAPRPSMFPHLTSTPTSALGYGSHQHQRQPRTMDATPSMFSVVSDTDSEVYNDVYHKPSLPISAQRTSSRPPRSTSTPKAKTSPHSLSPTVARTNDGNRRRLPSLDLPSSGASVRSVDTESSFHSYSSAPEESLSQGKVLESTSMLSLGSKAPALGYIYTPPLERPELQSMHKYLAYLFSLDEGSSRHPVIVSLMRELSKFWTCNSSAKQSQHLRDTLEEHNISVQGTLSSVSPPQISSRLTETKVARAPSTKRKGNSDHTGSFSRAPRLNASPTLVVHKPTERLKRSPSDLSHTSDRSTSSSPLGLQRKQSSPALKSSKSSALKQLLLDVQADVQAIFGDKAASQFPFLMKATKPVSDVPQVPPITRGMDGIMKEHSQEDPTPQSKNSPTASPTPVFHEAPLPLYSEESGMYFYYDFISGVSPRAGDVYLNFSIMIGPEVVGGLESLGPFQSVNENKEKGADEIEVLKKSKEDRESEGKDSKPDRLTLAVNTGQLIDGEAANDIILLTEIERLNANGERRFVGWTMCPLFRQFPLSADPDIKSGEKEKIRYTPYCRQLCLPIFKNPIPELSTLHTLTLDRLKTFTLAPIKLYLRMYTLKELTLGLDLCQQYPRLSELDLPPVPLPTSAPDDIVAYVFQHPLFSSNHLHLKHYVPLFDKTPVVQDATITPSSHIQIASKILQEWMNPMKRRASISTTRKLVDDVHNNASLRIGDSAHSNNPQDKLPPLPAPPTLTAANFMVLEAAKKAWTGDLQTSAELKVALPFLHLNALEWGDILYPKKDVLSPPPRSSSNPGKHALGILIHMYEGRLPKMSRTMKTGSRSALEHESAKDALISETPIDTPRRRISFSTPSDESRHPPLLSSSADTDDWNLSFSSTSMWLPPIRTYDVTSSVYDPSTSMLDSIAYPSSLPPVTPTASSWTKQVSDAQQGGFPAAHSTLHSLASEVATQDPSSPSSSSMPPASVPNPSEDKHVLTFPLSLNGPLSPTELESTGLVFRIVPGSDVPVAQYTHPRVPSMYCHISLRDLVLALLPKEYHPFLAQPNSSSLSSRSLPTSDTLDLLTLSALDSAAALSGKPPQTKEIALSLPLFYGVPSQRSPILLSSGANGSEAPYVGAMDVTTTSPESILHGPIPPPPSFVLHPAPQCHLSLRLFTSPISLRRLIGALFAPVEPRLSLLPNYTAVLPGTVALSAREPSIGSVLKDLFSLPNESSLVALPPKEHGSQLEPQVPHIRPTVDTQISEDEMELVFSIADARKPRPPPPLFPPSSPPFVHYSAPIPPGMTQSFVFSTSATPFIDIPHRFGGIEICIAGAQFLPDNCTLSAIRASVLSFGGVVSQDTFDPNAPDSSDALQWIVTPVTGTMDLSSPLLSPTFNMYLLLVPEDEQACKDVSIPAPVSRVSPHASIWACPLLPSKVTPDTFLFLEILTLESHGGGVQSAGVTWINLFSALQRHRYEHPRIPFIEAAMNPSNPPEYTAGLKRSASGNLELDPLQYTLNEGLLKLPLFQKQTYSGLSILPPLYPNSMRRQPCVSLYLSVRPLRIPYAPLTAPTPSLLRNALFEYTDKYPFVYPPPYTPNVYDTGLISLYPDEEVLYTHRQEEVVPSAKVLLFEIAQQTRTAYEQWQQANPQMVTQLSLEELFPPQPLDPSHPLFPYLPSELVSFGSPPPLENGDDIFPVYSSWVWSRLNEADPAPLEPGFVSSYIPSAGVSLSLKQVFHMDKTHIRVALEQARLWWINNREYMKQNNEGKNLSIVSEQGESNIASGVGIHPQLLDPTNTIETVLISVSHCIITPSTSKISVPTYYSLPSKEPPSASGPPTPTLQPQLVHHCEFSWEFSLPQSLYFSESTILHHDLEYNPDSFALFLVHAHGWPQNPQSLSGQNVYPGEAPPSLTIPLAWGILPLFDGGGEGYALSGAYQVPLFAGAPPAALFSIGHPEEPTDPAQPSSPSSPLSLISVLEALFAPETTDTPETQVTYPDAKNSPSISTFVHHFQSSPYSPYGSLSGALGITRNCVLPSVLVATVHDHRLEPFYGTSNPMPYPIPPVCPFPEHYPSTAAMFMTQSQWTRLPSPDGSDVSPFDGEHHEDWLTERDAWIIQNVGEDGEIRETLDGIPNLLFTSLNLAIQMDNTFPAHI